MRNEKTFLRCDTCRAYFAANNKSGRYKQGPERRREANLRDKYGITLEQYEALRAAQQGRCWICQRHEDEIPGGPTGRPRADGTPNAPAAKLVPDHCHRTGVIRGLLCHSCNSGIGLLGEDPLRLARAIEYLARSLVS